MGTIVEAGPVAANGVVSFDGQGRLAGTDTASVNGMILKRTFDGDYQVSATCTGVANLVFTDGETVSIDLQLVGSTEEVTFIQTDEGTVITGAARKMGLDVAGMAAPTRPTHNIRTETIANVLHA
jgi:hypothetical protein